MNLQSGGNSTIILAFANGVVADVYTLAFESCFTDFSVRACATISEARKVLARVPDACVVMDAALGGGSLQDIFRDQSLLARRSQIFLLGSERAAIPADATATQVEFLPADVSMKEVVSKVEAHLRVTATTSRFCKISLKSLLVRNDRLRCDVYLKLSDNKFVKVLHAQDPFDQEEYERFRAKNVEFLYLPKGDFLELMQELLEKVKALNANPEAIETDVAIETSNAIFQTVHAAFDTEGFTPELQRLTLATVDLAINTVKKNPKLRDLLAKINAKRDSYISWHSTALSFLACKLATLLNWQSESTFFKLSLASILHDITLPQDHLAQLITLVDVENAKLPDEVKAMVLRHPLDASQLLNGFDEIPGEVGFIVEQHHERQDGLGFPRGIVYKDISPVSALFIIAHDIVNVMFHAPPENFEMRDFLQMREHEKRYTKGSFGQVFRALMSKTDEM